MFTVQDLITELGYQDPDKPVFFALRQSRCDLQFRISEVLELGEVEDCYNCDGTGEFQDVCENCEGDGEIDGEECITCDGTGNTDGYCVECEGEGTITETEPAVYIEGYEDGYAPRNG